MAVFGDGPLYNPGAKRLWRPLLESEGNTLALLVCQACYRFLVQIFLAQHCDARGDGSHRLLIFRPQLLDRIVRLRQTNCAHGLTSSRRHTAIDDKVNARDEGALI